MPGVYSEAGNKAMTATTSMSVPSIQSQPQPKMLPASRWAIRLSRSPRTFARSIATKDSGLARKVPRVSRDGSGAATRRVRRDSSTPRKRDDQSISKEKERDSSHQQEPAPPQQLQNALQEAAVRGENDMLTPVYIPEDPYSIIKETHPAMSILANSTIIVQRQLEMMNLLVGFEQANRYVILNALGDHIGYLAEPQGNMLKRQLFKTHRGFTAHVFDRHEREVLRISRPFTFINSRVGVYDAVNSDPNSTYQTSDALSGLSVGSIANQSSAQLSSLPTEQMRIIGEVQQQWAPLRRKYNLFLNRTLEQQTLHLPPDPAHLSTSTALAEADPRQDQDKTLMQQWAHVDEPFLSWDFSLRSESSRLLGSVNRNFTSFGRELFTDTGVYALRMDSAALAADSQSQTGRNGSEVREYAAEGMTLDQRAVMLATAVSIDFDYFSRKSGHGILPMPMWIPMGGGEAAGGAAAGGAAAEGAAGGVIGGAASEAAGGVATRGAAGALGEAGTAGMAGAGTMAGYEAMQRGVGGGDVGGASPGEGNWWEESEARDGAGQDGDWPWGGGDSGSSSSGGGGGGDDGGGSDWLGDFFE